MKKAKGFLLILFLGCFIGAIGQPVVCDSTPYTRINPTMVAPNTNMIFNNGFEMGNFNYWKDEAFGMGYYPIPTSFAYNNPALQIISGAATAHTGIYAASLNLPANPNLTNVEVRQSLPSLQAATSYTVTAWMRAVNATVPSVTINILYIDNRGHWSRQTLTSSVFHPTTSYAQVSYTFSISSPFPVPLKLQDVNLQIMVSAGGIYLDDVVINSATGGGEWSAISTSVPTPQGTFSENFTGAAGTTLNSSKWLVCQKQWGGSNQGVVPENLELNCGYMRFHGHGTSYTGTVTGEDGVTVTQVGSAIATKEYFASGRYDIVAKLAPGGVVSAFWPYHYIEDATYQFDFPDGWATVQNTEIDWEFPANIRCNAGISGSAIIDANCNTYGSKCDGTNIVNSPGAYDPSSTGYSWRESITAVTGADASSGYHTYTIIWHSGDAGAGVAPSVEWLIDNVSIVKESRAHYVPYRAARLWIGVWYGKQCWSGSQAYSDTYMDVKSVSITPYNEANDRYESESDPFVGYLSSAFNPVYPSGCTPLPIKLISFNGKCMNASTALFWTTTTETDNSYYTIESSQDGQEFAAIGTINGAGNSNSIINYEFNDYQKSGNYYRLKQTDVNGLYSYSNIINVDCSNEYVKVWTVEEEVQVEISNLNGDSNCTIMLYDMTGQQLYTEDKSLKEGQNLFQIKQSLSLSHAIYVVKIIKGSDIKTQKVLL
jgi:hypothetical protein